MEEISFYNILGTDYDSRLEKNAPLYVEEDVEHWEQEKEFEDLDLEF